MINPDQIEKVVNAYLKDLVLYAKEYREERIDGKLYRNNVFIGEASIIANVKHFNYMSYCNINIDPSIPSSILNLFGLDKYGKDFNDNSANGYHIHKILSKILADKLNKYYLEVNGYNLTSQKYCDVSSHYVLKSVDVSSFERVNLY